MRTDLPYDIGTLLGRIANNDQKAFRILFDIYKAPFHAAAFKMTRSNDISQDIVQEAFVTIWIKREMVASSAKPEGYIFTILHNCIYAHFRRIARDFLLRSQLGQEEDRGENMTEVLMDRIEDQVKLDNIISSMPPQQRLIYKMIKQEGLSRNEVSKRLNISPNTVKNHLAAAIKSLLCHLTKSTSALIWAVILIRL